MCANLIERVNSCFSALVVISYQILDSLPKDVRFKIRLLFFSCLDLKFIFLIWYHKYLDYYLYKLFLIINNFG